jgi:hypothetical protein
MVLAAAFYFAAMYYSYSQQFYQAWEYLDLKYSPLNNCCFFVKAPRNKLILLNPNFKKVGNSKVSYSTSGNGNACN